MPQKNKNKKKNTRRQQAQRPQQKSKRRSKRQNQMTNMLSPTPASYIPRAGAPGYGALVSSVPTFPRTYVDIKKYGEGSVNGITIAFGGPIFIAAQSTSLSVIGNWNVLNSQSYVGNNGEALPLSPGWSIPYGSPAVAALGYNRYRFRSVKMTWVGLRTTSADESFGIAYNPDGALQNADYDYLSLMKNPANMYTPVWSSASLDATKELDTKTWYYTDEDAAPTTDAGLRQSFQGAHVLGFNTIINGKTQGLLYINAVIDCIEPMPFQQNIALTSKLLRKGKDSGEEPVVVETPVLEKKRASGK